ncbi:MAG: hypothetical protein ACREXY_27320, partial [Gammaproteobacteria bacterium]
APQRLTPRRSDEAEAWSLSGSHGLDAFPWHTDGAVALAPPQWVLLEAKEVSSPTYTDLLLPTGDLLRLFKRTTLRAKERQGQVRWLPAWVPDGAHGRLRWDERTCQPNRDDVVGAMAQARSSDRVEWIPGRVLILNNRRVLHRRPAVGANQLRVLDRVYVWGD